MHRMFQALLLLNSIVFHPDRSQLQQVFGLTKELIECLPVHQVHISPCVCLKQHSLRRCGGVFYLAPQCCMLQCYGKLDQMFVCMRNTNHMCKYRLSIIIKVEGFTRPCPCRTGRSLWNFE